MKINVETLTREISREETEEFLSKFPEVQAWLRTKGEKTKKGYVRALMRYLETLKENGIIEGNPTDLYNLAKENGEYGTHHVEILEEFQTSCEDSFPEGQRSIIVNITIPIKSFYSFKGKNYQFPKGRGDYSVETKKRQKPKLDDIIPYIDTIPHLRNQMIVAVETSFPIRLESWTFLKWSHFKEVLEGKELPHVFLVSKEMKGKGKGEKYKGLEQHSFLTPFAKDYVLRWKREYEEIRQVKIDPNEPETLELPFLITLKGETKGKELSYSGLNQLFDRCKSERFPFSIHTWRTFVNEALKCVNVLKEDRDIILGHKPEKVEEAYSDLNIQRLRKEFRKAVPYLDPTYKEDERVQKVREAIKKTKGIEVSEEEAKEILDKVLMEFFKGSD